MRSKNDTNTPPGVARRPKSSKWSSDWREVLSRRLGPLIRPSRSKKKRQPSAPKKLQVAVAVTFCKNAKNLKEKKKNTSRDRGLRRNSYLQGFYAHQQNQAPKLRNKNTDRPTDRPVGRSVGRCFYCVILGPDFVDERKTPANMSFDEVLDLLKCFFFFPLNF